MKSARRGGNISGAEVQGVTAHGIWLLVGKREHFLSYREYPWFRKAPVEEVRRVKLLSPNHLHWPQLDIDLEVESLDDPKDYPLVYR